MNRTYIRRRRGDLGGPIVTLLLAVAGIAIAGGVIAYMMGFIGNLQKPNIEADSVTLMNVSKHWILSFTVDATNSRSLKISKIVIFDDKGANTIDLNGKEIVIKSGFSGTESIDLTKLGANLNLGNQATYKVVLYTNAGTYRLTATLEG